ncbi:MAG: helix-turn-helix transcriptional regulator [Pseudomonadota bacterium]
MDRRRSSHIIPEIYEATTDPSHWDYVLTMIAKFTYSKSACLYYKSSDMKSSNCIANVGFDEKQQVNLNHHCESLDTIFANKRRATKEDAICTQFYPGSNGVLSEDDEIYKEWIKPSGNFHLGGAQFLENDQYTAGIAILRDETAGSWTDGEFRIIEEILPHLRRALNIHSEFTHLRLKQDALLKGLDRLVIGLVLYDRHANPVYINPTAEAIIDQHPGLSMQNGTMTPTNSKDEQHLRNLIMETGEIDPDDSWKQSVAIGITHPDVESPLPILVSPMHANLITSDLDYEGAKVAVFLSDPNLQQPISVDSLVSVYNLTPSEAQVAISLANGHSVDQIATITHHSTHTIRTQLKSIFRKTGSTRQSELIKLLLTGPFAQRRRSVATS